MPDTAPVVFGILLDADAGEKKRVMERGFYIILNLKTGSGFEKYGKFFIGEDAGEALDLFRRLRGSEEPGEKNFLQVDFMEVRDDLPVNIKLLCCTLDEMTENFRIITKEIFKRYNLQV